MRELELLAPAKDKTLGMAAVDHGADAVYIGAQRFGARAAAGNPVEEIEALCRYAHFYRARVYVAMNTLLFDHELEAARELIFGLWEAGADALIIQDMGLLELDLPPIPLFASTQTDNQTPEKVRFLEETGFQRVILARELDLKAMARIRAATSVELEAFVHGALCVCYSGQCYLSAAIGGRSANRGACGQPCRLPWNLVDRSGRVIEKGRHLLCLKDMDRSDHLADLVAAGITSFKIEGRLKDLAYVKNITGFYRQKLDAFLEGRTGFQKGSSGRVFFFFTPDPAKTFNRGATDYYLRAETPGAVHSLDTPKSRGEALGEVRKVGKGWFSLTGDQTVQNGDGLCFVDDQGQLQGFRINRADPEGRLYLSGRGSVKGLTPGTRVWRNHDQAFSKLMAKETAKRRLALDLTLLETGRGLALEGQDEDGTCARVEMTREMEAAQDLEKAAGAIEKQLGKLGDTPFYLNRLLIPESPPFVRASDLNQLRRDLVQSLVRVREQGWPRPLAPERPAAVPYPSDRLDFRGNVANWAARQFYEKRGVKEMAQAFELAAPESGARVMTTRHCILHALGRCKKFDPPCSDLEGPLFIENQKGRFKIVFDCKACQMHLETTG